MQRIAKFRAMAHVVGVLWAFLLVTQLLSRHTNANDGSVDIINETSSQMLVRCRSGDNDLGNIYLQQYGDYYFHFGQNIFGTTFFYCTFSWGGFSKTVPVWKGKAYVDRLDCQMQGYCVWKATQRGFFWAAKGPLEPFYFFGEWQRSLDPPPR